HNSLPVRGKGRRMNLPKVAAQCAQIEMHLALPVIPLEATTRMRCSLFEQLPNKAYIVLLPGLLRQIHVGYIEIALCCQSLLLLPTPCHLGRMLSATGFDHLPRADRERHQQSNRNGRGGGENEPIAPNQFLEAVAGTRRPSNHWLVIQVPLDV